MTGWKPIVPIRGRCNDRLEAYRTLVVFSQHAWCSHQASCFFASSAQPSAVGSKTGNGRFY